MKRTVKRPGEIFEAKLIAACGMNCGVCAAYLRPKNPCPGCRTRGALKPKTRARCAIKLCRKRGGDFCFDCREFPCFALKRLDKRYRARYGMSEVENLVHIRDNGMRGFLESESRRWVSPEGVLCVHNKERYRFDDNKEAAVRRKNF